MKNERKGHSSYSEALDQSLQAMLGRFTSGVSPAALLLAFLDWYSHLIMHPAKQMELLEIHENHLLNLFHQYIALMSGDTKFQADIGCSKKDKRFDNQLWEIAPFNNIYQSFLMWQEWWHCAATNVRGVNKHHENVVDFSIRQLLDIFSPSNFPMTNPEIIETAIAENGANFTRGFENFIDDLRRNQLNEPPIGAEKYVIGKNVATTAGKVIYQNELIELIQYESEKNEVYVEPVLITPAWIMKYYILDLTPKHSLVRYLVKRGHTVFMISWKNPSENDSHLCMQDYLNLGIQSSLDIIKHIIPKTKIHLVGYCLGGTLAAIEAAYLAKIKDKILASLTLFAAQTDFTEPGELGLFIDESQISFLENIMKQKGYLDTHQMTSAFQLLRSNDLVWSRMIHDYLLGKRKPLNGLMAWNADTTRLPYCMHSEYLRQLFLNNQLAEAKYKINEKLIALQDITVPIFTVATERDHVSPWKSVFKINLLTTTEVTFALTSGGHNVGIVSMPSKKFKRHFRISTLDKNDRYIDADTWYDTVNPKEGSWWPAWEKWLSKHSSKKVSPPTIGNKSHKIIPIMDAPGSYVLEK